MVVALYSCDKDEKNDDKKEDPKDDIPASVIVDNKLTVTVENGSSYSGKIDSVKMTARDSEDDKVVITSAPYNNGVFTLELPVPFADIFLDALSDIDDFDGSTISNPNVKISDIDDLRIYAYKSGKSIGYFHFINNSDGWGGPMYANDDVIVTGNSTDDSGTYTFNVNLKKGWNMIYENGNATTSQAPAGLKWYFDEDENGEEPNVEIPPPSVIANNTITATVENGNNYNGIIDTVIMSMIDYGDIRKAAVANAPYRNGGFTLRLQETVSDTYLVLFEEDDFLDGVTVSNPDVKTGIAWIFAYNYSGEYLGEFIYRSSDWGSSLMYSNVNVIITGTETYEDGDVTKYNLHLQKGWNRIYWKESKINGKSVFEETSQAPFGMKWYFEEFD
jgi:hypothetical protein